MPPLASGPLSGQLAGQLAALGTAACWSCSSLAFEAAGRRIGTLSLNILRLLIATTFLAILGTVTRGLPLPVDATARAWLVLGISGLLGFTFGDLCLFRAFLVIGPRLSALLMALAPPLTALIGWLLLGETLGPRQLLGMALTVAGIAIAILERPAPQIPAESAAPAVANSISGYGIVLGIGAALGQASGLVLSKLGMRGYDPFAATQVRVIAGAAGYALLITALRRWPRVREATGDRIALGWASVGAFFGPFVGVSLSLIAVQRTLAGVAASLMATTPILIIPFVVLLRGEKVGLAGVGGAIVAVAGVALLVL